MNWYDLARGLHILAIIAWMAGLLFLPRLYAYDAEQNSKAEPLRSEMQTLLRTWQARLLRIILDPAMTLAWIFGGWLIWLNVDGMGWALKMNQLKMSCSEMAPKLVHEALQIIGIMAYKNDSKFSVGRHYRDVLSASLMVSNERIAGKSASMLLVFKDD